MKETSLRSRNPRVHKQLLFFFLFLPLTLHAKSYEVIISPCETGTNCKKCYEIVKVTYIVDTKSKKVIASGMDINGKLIKEPIETCQITDENNWICDAVSLTTQVKNSVITLINKPDSIMARSKKEICLIK